MHQIIKLTAATATGVSRAAAQMCTHKGSSEQECHYSPLLFLK